MKMKDNAANPVATLDSIDPKNSRPDHGEIDEGVTAHGLRGEDFRGHSLHRLDAYEYVRIAKSLGVPVDEIGWVNKRRIWALPHWIHDAQQGTEAWDIVASEFGFRLARTRK